MRGLLLIALPFLLYGESLKSFLEYAQNSNELIVSKSIVKESKKSELKSSESDYYPTVDVGGFYQRYDEASPIMPGTTYSAYATVGFDVYSGGKKSYTQKQKSDEYRASQFDFEATKKSTSLAIVQDFYNLKNLQASLSALKESSNAVKAQLERVQQFYDAELATSDDVDRLQSAYDKNIYMIDSTSFEIYTLQKQLELKVGKNIESFDEAVFKKLNDNSSDELDLIKSLRATKSSILNASHAIDSYYYPQVRIENTYSFYGYQNEPTAFPIEQLDNQNKIMATVNMRLVDFGAIGEAKEAVRLQADAMQQRIIYQIKEQKMNQELSRKRIETAELNIKSSASALKASSSALKTITEKYSAGIVDNVVYLDALSSNTEAKSAYESSLNNLEMSYALYYYYKGKNIEEFLNE
ncbi:MAG: TolC family protein [Campylobacterota bacterium]